MEFKTVEQNGGLVVLAHITLIISFVGSFSSWFEDEGLMDSNTRKKEDNKEELAKKVISLVTLFGYLDVDSLSIYIGHKAGLI